MDTADEKSCAAVETALANQGYELGDIILFMDEPIWVIEPDDQQKYYVGLYNTHNSYYAKYEGDSGRFEFQ